MIAVAVVGLLPGVGVASWRLKALRDRYLRMAAAHAKIEALVRERQRREEDLQATYTKWARTEQEIVAKRQGRPRPWYESFLTNSERTIAGYQARAKDCSATIEIAALRADCHARLKDKYERAADRPWTRVEPDGPEPPWP
jgi:hypothetical protein